MTRITEEGKMTDRRRNGLYIDVPAWAPVIVWCALAATLLLWAGL